MSVGKEVSRDSTIVSSTQSGQSTWRPIQEKVAGCPDMDGSNQSHVALPRTIQSQSASQAFRPIRNLPADYYSLL